MVDSRTPAWMDSVTKELAKGRRDRALRILGRVIEDDLPLLWGEAEILEERHLAWLYRINLLREAGRLSEALAWTCLECDLFPDNVEAVAVKERLKRQLALATESTGAAEKNIDDWPGLAGTRSWSHC